MAGIDKRFPAMEGHNETLEIIETLVERTIGAIAVDDGSVVPYSGTESEQDMPVVVHVQHGTMRADLPA